MLLHLKGVLTPEELATARGLLADEALWLDGRTSAGAQASAVKRNEQLAQGQRRRPPSAGPGAGG